MKPVLLKVVICLALVSAVFFLFKKHEGKPWIIFPEPLENRYSISALVKETTKKEEAVVKPAKILRRITARIPTKVTQKPPKKKEQIVSKPKLSTLRKPRFTVYGAKYMLTLGVDNHERTISYYHVFDSEGTTIIRNGQRVRADYRIFRHDGYELDGFTYKRKPDRLVISVSSFATTLPTKEALSKGLKPHAIAYGSYVSKARNIIVKKGERFNVRINMVTGLPDQLEKDDPRVTHFDVERNISSNETH